MTARLSSRESAANRGILALSMVQSLGLYASLLRKPCEGRYFLVPNKKVTKEVGLGETLTVKSIGTSTVSLPTYPDFKPLSPKTPSRPLSVAGWRSFV